MNFMKNKAGFTLVELIVVIAILGILAGIAIPAYSGYIKKAEAAADTQTLSAIYTAASSAAIEEGVVTEIVVALDGTTENVKTITVKTEKFDTGHTYTYTAAGNGTAAKWTCATDSHGAVSCPVSDFELYLGTAQLTLTDGYKWTSGTWSAT